MVFVVLVILVINRNRNVAPSWPIIVVVAAGRRPRRRDSNAIIISIATTTALLEDGGVIVRARGLSKVRRPYGQRSSVTPGFDLDVPESRILEEVPPSSPGIPDDTVEAVLSLGEGVAPPAAVRSAVRWAVVGELGGHGGAQAPVHC